MMYTMEHKRPGQAAGWPIRWHASRPDPKFALYLGRDGGVRAVGDLGEEAVRGHDAEGGAQHLALDARTGEDRYARDDGADGLEPSVAISCAGLLRTVTPGKLRSCSDVAEAFVRFQQREALGRDAAARIARVKLPVPGPISTTGPETFWIPSVMRRATAAEDGAMATT